MMPTIVELTHVAKRRAELKLLKIQNCCQYLYRKILYCTNVQQQTKDTKTALQVYSLKKFACLALSEHIWENACSECDISPTPES